MRLKPSHSLLKHHAGFTLIEMLAAISILAIVAVLGWRGLDSIVRSRTALSAELTQARAVQLTFTQLQRDCALMAPPALLGTRPALLAVQDRLFIVRQVFSEQQPTQVQVVGYRLRDGVLTRQASLATRDLAALDVQWQAALSEASSTDNSFTPVTLQTDVRALQMRLWADGGSEWQAPGVPLNMADAAKGKEPPRWSGLEVALQLGGNQGRVVRAFFLGAA